MNPSLSDLDLDSLDQDPMLSSRLVKREGEKVRPELETRVVKSYRHEVTFRIGL